LWSPFFACGGWRVDVGWQAGNSPFLWKGGTPCFASRGGKGGFFFTRVEHLATLTPFAGVARSSPFPKERGITRVNRLISHRLLKPKTLHLKP